MKKRNIKKNKKEKGFVILIAIVVSGLLVSLGLFIANVSYKELILSNSAKYSQIAFFAADSVMECALYYDIWMGGFKEDDNDSDVNNNNFNLPCNGFEFKLSDSDSNSGLDSALSVYYVSLSSDLTDTNNDGVIDTGEIGGQKDEIENDPLVKLVVQKKNNGDDTEMTAYGHNAYRDNWVVERAIQVTY